VLILIAGEGLATELKVFNAGVSPAQPMLNVVRIDAFAMEAESYVDPLVRSQNGNLSTVVQQLEDIQIRVKERLVLLWLKEGSHAKNI